jgi:ribosome-associated protein
LTVLADVGLAVSAAADKKAGNLVVIDVGDFLSITDYFVIASGASERQVRTIADEVEARLKESGIRPLRTEGGLDGGWLLLDYGVFVVHVFTNEMRKYYELERLWKDAPRPELPELVEARRVSGE